MPKLTAKDILEEGPSICELVLQAHKEAIRNDIEANSIMLNKNVVHVPEKFGYYPEMICGLKVYLTSDELPDDYAFAVFNNPWHEKPVDMDRITDLVYDLLDEYDIGLWNDIGYTELADKWVALVRKYACDNDSIKRELKEFLKGE